MDSISIAAPSITLIWAGVSLGGSLIAAPAKFRAKTLDLATALDVGRAQFSWLGYVEWLLFFLLMVTLYLSRSELNWQVFLVPIILFLFQRIALMPKLNALTLDRIAVVAMAKRHSRSGYLHTLYVAAEVVKFLTLIGASLYSLKTLTASL